MRRLQWGAGVCGGRGDLTCVLEFQ